MVSLIFWVFVVVSGKFVLCVVEEILQKGGDMTGRPQSVKGGHHRGNGHLTQRERVRLTDRLESLRLGVARKRMWIEDWLSLSSGDMSLLCTVVRPELRREAITALENLSSAAATLATRLKKPDVKFDANLLKAPLRVGEPFAFVGPPKPNLTRPDPMEVH